jgi:hypothetical protein
VLTSNGSIRHNIFFLCRARSSALHPSPILTERFLRYWILYWLDLVCRPLFRFILPAPIISWLWNAWWNAGCQGIAKYFEEKPTPVPLLLIYLWFYSHLLDLGRFFSFLNFYTVGRAQWTGDQPVARPLPAHRTPQTQNKRTPTSMPRVGFEPAIPLFERAEAVHALDRAATVIGPVPLSTPQIPYDLTLARILVRRGRKLAMARPLNILCLRPWRWSRAFRRVWNFVMLHGVSRRDSVLGIATVYGLDDLELGVRVPVRSGIVSTSSRPALGFIQPPIQWVPGREADHSPPDSAEVKKLWIYTSTPPYAFMA